MHFDGFPSLARRGDDLGDARGKGLVHAGTGDLEESGLDGLYAARRDPGGSSLGMDHAGAERGAEQDDCG